MRHVLQSLLQVQVLFAQGPLLLLQSHSLLQPPDKFALGLDDRLSGEYFPLGQDDCVYVLEAVRADVFSSHGQLLVQLLVGYRHC
jgi:hypothetical protein